MRARSLGWVLLMVGALVSCRGGSTPTPERKPPPQPSIEACELVTPIDAGFALRELSVQPAPDPFSSPVFEGIESALSSGCLYEPDPNEIRFVAVGVFTSEYLEDTFETDVESAEPLEVDGFEAWNKEGGIFVRQGDVGFIVIVAPSAAGRSSDAGLLAAQAAVSHLASILTPAASPTPDAEVAACGLLTEDLAESVAGGTDMTLDAAMATDPVRSHCIYGGGEYELSLNLTQAPDGAIDYEGIKSASDPSQVEFIPGLGDDAFRLLGIFVLVDDAMLDIAAFRGGDIDDELTLELARQLVASS